MKKIPMMIGLMIMPLLLMAQQSPAERVFKKYAGVTGITSVQISSGMFGMLANMDSENDDLRKLASSISSVYILHAPEDAAITLEMNFYDEVMKDLPVKKYNELMRVNSADQQVLILADESNGIIKELLLLVGGKTDNALIYIEGNLDMKQLASLSNVNVPGMEHFHNLEK
jgi:hypothetical protein